MLKSGEKVGEYVLLERLGTGGFGEVWKAEKRTEFSVSYFAIKFFRPKDNEEINVEAVKREVGTWQSLNGLQNIISVIEANRFEDYVYIVSEFAEGGSLERWLKTNDGKVNSHEEAVAITRQILQGLEGMHGEGFVHRDLKPANVLIKRGIFYLADFGITRQMKTHSKTNSTAGTYEFMPPEAFEKSPSVSIHTDIWATGAILQLLLTRQLPFPEDEIPSLITAILYNEPEPLPESVPPGLREIVKKSLQKKREDRFQTASEMSAALKNPQKFLESRTFSKTETNTDENSDKTVKLEIAPTKDWREIEAEKEQHRKLELSKLLKRTEESRYLQELEFKRKQVLSDRVERELEEKQHIKAKKIWFGVIGTSFLIVIVAIIGWINWIKSSENTSTNQWVNINTASIQSVNNTSNLSANTTNNVPLSNSATNSVNINALAQNSNSNNATLSITTATVTVWMRSCGDGCNPVEGDADWSNGIVILKTSKGKFKSRTNDNGRASFSNVPCGKIVITFEPAYFGETYNRVIPCNKSQVNLGKFMVGEPAV